MMSTVDVKIGTEAKIEEVAFKRMSVWRMMTSDVGSVISIIIVGLAIFCGLFAGWLAPEDPYGGNLAMMLKPVGTEGYLLGTDAQGRDMITRLLYGTRMSMLIGVVSVFFGCALGGVIGFMAAFYRRIDGVFMRTMDVLLSFPAILFGLAIAARGAAIVVLQQDYIESARSLGMSDTRIIRKYVLPNCLSSIFVFVTLRFGQVILLGAALSFIGLGAQPPTAELGAMAADGRNYLFFAPHVSVLPSLVIFLIVLAFNVLGDSLRDALDPKLRK